MKSHDQIRIDMDNLLLLPTVDQQTQAIETYLKTLSREEASYAVNYGASRGGQNLSALFQTLRSRLGT